MSLPLLNLDLNLQIRFLTFSNPYPLQCSNQTTHHPREKSFDHPSFQFFGLFQRPWSKILIVLKDIQLSQLLLGKLNIIF